MSEHFPSISHIYLLPAPKFSVDFNNFRGDFFATHLWFHDGRPLNEFQYGAMELALKRKFQLIQGPPGAYE